MPEYFFFQENVKLFITLFLSLIKNFFNYFITTMSRVDKKENSIKKYIRNIKLSGESK